MLAFTGSSRIFIHQPSIDMRKGIERLCAIVENEFSGELLTGAFFVFINKSKDKMKVLYWDTDGFALWLKRLEKGRFRVRDLQKGLIERKEFIMLLEGIIPKRIQSRYKLV